MYYLKTTDTREQLSTLRGIDKTSNPIVLLVTQSGGLNHES